MKLIGQPEPPHIGVLTQQPRRISHIDQPLVAIPKLGIKHAHAVGTRGRSKNTHSDP